MSINSLAHSKWIYKYHIVFAPKYRRKAIYKDVKADVDKFCEVYLGETELK